MQRCSRISRLFEAYSESTTSANDTTRSSSAPPMSLDNMRRAVAEAQEGERVDDGIRHAGQQAVKLIVCDVCELRGIPRRNPNAIVWHRRAAVVRSG